VQEGSQPRERFLMLKDIQLGTVAGADQGLLKASYLAVQQHDAGLCGTPAAGEPYRGACFNAGSGWLFTVNGQLHPHLTVKAGSKEIWRIANTSADMSYDIALVERGSVRPLRMQPIARDGVAAAQEGGNGPILIERALLMPSARIEVAIDRTTSEGLFVDAQPLDAVLKSYGYYSGGDAWPAVDLAVTFEAAPASTASASTPGPSPLPANATARSAHEHKGSRPALERTFVPMLVRGWQAAPGPAARSTRSAEKPIGAPRGDASRRSGSAATPGPGARPFPLPSSEQCAPLAPGEERIIALAIDKTGGEEKFKIGAVRAKRTALPPGEWDTAVQKAIDASRAFADNGPLLCAHAGTIETWTIVNKPFQDNQETHNFHIHQTKFEVVDVSDPNARIEVPRGGASAKRMVDNYPVPIGGSIRIKVGFLGQQAGGRFVFHCHILEHEDKGMMAEIEVLPGGPRGRRN
jgi:FtsP/CotA-like multicopper oxidase with cupredoxin domain